MSLKLRNLGFSGSLFPSVKVISTNISDRRHQRRGRFNAFVAAKRTSSSDYYSVLNVGRNATLQEIKASYRKLARKVIFTYLPSYTVWLNALIDRECINMNMENAS